MSLDGFSDKVEKRRLRLLMMLCIIAISAVPSVLVLGSYQPYFGSKICILKGFMWNADFVQEVRPTIREIVRQQLILLRNEDDSSTSITEKDVLAKLDLAIDKLKQCVSERGLDYCRYIGPDLSHATISATTHDGINTIARDDEHKYKFIDRTIGFEFYLIPQNSGGSQFTLSLLDKTPISLYGNICYLGCYCNVRYGL